MGIIHVFSIVSNVDLYAEISQPSRCLGILQIRAGNVVPEVVKYLGYSGHADSPYAYKVYDPVSLKHSCLLCISQETHRDINYSSTCLRSPDRLTVSMHFYPQLFT